MSGPSPASSVPLDAPGPDETIVRQKRSAPRGIYVVVAVVIVGILLLAGAYAGGLLAPKSTSSGSCPPPNMPLSGAGSTLVAPLMYEWSSQYTASTVDYNSIGSGAGIAQITAKTVDFGASDAPLSPGQRAAVPSPGVLTIPESVGGVVPIYNLVGIGGGLNFTGSVLAQIYLGKIQSWNDPAITKLNPGVDLPNQPIIVVYRADPSGTSFIWTSYLSAENATWKSTVGFGTAVQFPTGVAEKGNAGITNTVKTTADALGYVDINYALTENLSYGAVQNPSGNFIHASLTNIASAVRDSSQVLPSASGDWYNVSLENAPGAEDYPITSYTYIFVYKDLGAAYGSAYSAAKAENLVDFLEWIVSASGGQQDATPLYYIPLTNSTIASDTTAIDSITYNGAAIALCATG